VDANLEYPILYFCANDLLLFTDADQDSFTRVRVRALKGNYFKGFYVVDSKGNGYRLKAVQKVGYDPPFFGWFIGEIKIDMKFDNPEPVDLEELKNHLLRVINQDIEYWDSMVGRDVADLKEAIRNAGSAKEIIEFLQE